MFLHLNSESRWATENGVRRVDTFAMFTLYEMSLWLKFLGLTVKFGQNENKIDNIKL